MSEVQIRTASMADVDAVEAIRQEALAERPLVENPEDHLIPAAQALAGPAIVAEREGEVVGVLSWKEVGDVVFGGLFIIARKHRGLGGIARALMREGWRRTAGARRGFFICEDRVARFYESLGFRRVGVAMECLWPK